MAVVDERSPAAERSRFQLSINPSEANEDFIPKMPNTKNNRMNKQ
jgi:hypothetical protein